MDITQVRRIATYWFRKTHGAIEFGDMLSAGAIGALESERVKPGNTFAAGARIQYRIIDELQSRHQVKRGAYKAGLRHVGYSEKLEPTCYNNPLLDGAKLTPAFNTLTEREQLVMKLAYWRGLNDCEIAKRVGISAVRVGQLQRNAMLKLRAHFGVEEMQ